MSEYKTEILTIEGTNALDVAKTLARSKGFPDTSTICKTNARYSNQASRSIILYHPDIVERLDIPFLAEPDIIVTPIFNAEKQCVDKYEVQIKVDC